MQPGTMTKPSKPFEPCVHACKQRAVPELSKYNYEPTQSIWSKSSCLKSILKLIAQSCVMRVNLFLPLRLVLSITWSYKIYPTGCIGLGFQSCKPVLSCNRFGVNWLRYRTARNNDTTIPAICVLRTCMQTASSASIIKTQLWVKPVNTGIVLSQSVHAKYHIRCELRQYTARYPRHGVLSLSTNNNCQIQTGNGITHNSVFYC